MGIRRFGMVKQMCLSYFIMIEIIEVVEGPNETQAAYEWCSRLFDEQGH